MGSFDADGFQVNRQYLTNTAYDNTNWGAGTYVAWCWKANGGTTSSNTDGSVTGTIQVKADAGFSIIKYVGDGGGIGGNGTVGHGLGYTPRFVIGKSSSATNSWICYLHDGTDYWHGYLGGTSALSKNGSNTQIGTPNDTTIGLSHAGTNQSGVDYIYYAWTPRSEYSKFGSYQGTGAVNNVITIGFRPDFIIIKKTTGTGNWRMFDSVRGTDKSLRANVNLAEYDDSANYLDFESTGFAFRTGNTGITNSDLNENGQNYIYAAFKIIN